jgi:hypothetical protein
MRVVPRASVVSGAGVKTMVNHPNRSKAQLKAGDMVHVKGNTIDPTTYELVEVAASGFDCSIREHRPGTKTALQPFYLSLLVLAPQPKAELVASLQSYVRDDDAQITDRRAWLRMVADRIVDDIGAAS